MSTVCRNRKYLPILLVLQVLNISVISDSFAQNSYKFKDLKKVGNRFSFAICADPQVYPKEYDMAVAKQARLTQILACHEINNTSPMPAFTIFLGDIVNLFDDKSVEAFMDCISDLKSMPVLVHGNHDTRPPYEGFKKLLKDFYGFEDLWYSFDVGSWHMVVIPCNLNEINPPEEGKKWEAAMLAWLAKEIEQSKNKPTIVFAHEHIVPLGLSQLEWYTYPLDIRHQMLDLLTRHGNVKYYFNGHVHNGLKASVKMAWEYKGIKFITVPTIIQSRPFGEEYEKFEHGLKDGGYYMIVEVQDSNVVLKGRLAGTQGEVVYPDNFKTLDESIEPRWFSRVSDMKASEILANGSFKDGLNGWFKAYRYMADQEPAYVYKVTDKSPDSNSNSVYIYTREKPPAFWGCDERSEVYQIVSMPKADLAVLKASYRLDKAPVNGGGYIRLTAFRNAEYKFLMMFKWGQEYEYPANYLPRCLGYELVGRQQSWAFLQDEGKAKRGMYFNISAEPQKWHELVVNIASLYDKAVGIDGAFEKLGITKLYIGAATWCNKDAGAQSGAYFTKFSLESLDSNIDASVDGKPLAVVPEIFKNQFGQSIIDTERANQKRNK